MKARRVTSRKTCSQSASYFHVCVGRTRRQSQRPQAAVAHLERWAKKDEDDSLHRWPHPCGSRALFRLYGRLSQSEHVLRCCHRVELRRVFIVSSRRDAVRQKEERKGVGFLRQRY